jgi:hypothetical protein
MTQQFLRWWLWVALTGVAAAVAGLKGFYVYLWQHDMTCLGVAILALYVIATASIGVAAWRRTHSYPIAEHILDSIPYIGLLGTFIGLAYALAALQVSGLTPESLNGMDVRALLQDAGADRRPPGALPTTSCTPRVGARSAWSRQGLARGQRKAIAIAVKSVSSRRQWSKLRERLSPAGRASNMAAPRAKSDIT